MPTSSHRAPKLAVGHRPVSRPCQRMAVDLLEHKSRSNNSKYATSVIDHLTRLFDLVVISDKSSAIITRVLVERVFFGFSAPETLHSDIGSEYENELVKEFRFKKTRTSAYRLQGISVLERVYSTMHNMLAMYVNVKYDNWAQSLPVIQLAHNTAYNKTLEETPNCLMLGRRASIPVDVILDIPCTSGSGTWLDYSRRTVENLQLAYEIAHRNLQTRREVVASCESNPGYPKPSVSTTANGKTRQPRISDTELNVNTQARPCTTSAHINGKL